MKDQEINILIRYLAGEELSPLEQEEVNQLIELYADEFKEIEQAYKANIFSSIHFDSKAAFERIQSKIRNKKEVKTIPFYQQNWFKVAASFIILFGSALSILFFAKWNVEIKNDTASLLRMELPDGSDLCLDKNATITYKTGFLNQFDRQVFMSGRVEYQVCKQNGEKFTVHTHQNTVTVLGTMFTINEEIDQTQIFLNEGKIKLNGTEPINDLVLDQEGAQIIFNDQEVIKHNIVPTQLYSSWTDKKITFNDCSVQEILSFLLDSYQVEASIQDSNLLSNPIFGSAPSDDPHLIIKALSEILKTDIKARNKQN